ncbi:MAG: hypothetical protein PHR36_01990, partial [Patescibacteria group bacterium]|nr:hypothetical protein [Patescibacteria group bacterium]
MATIIVIIARRECHFREIIVMPLKFKAPTVAVASRRRKANIPPYIIRGLPKNKVNAMLLIISDCIYNLIIDYNGVKFFVLGDKDSKTPRCQF